MSRVPQDGEHRHYTPSKLALALAEGLSADATGRIWEGELGLPASETAPTPRRFERSPRPSQSHRRSEPLWKQLWPRAPQPVLDTLERCPACRQAAVTLAGWCRQLDHPNPLVGPEAEIAPELLNELLLLPQRQRLARVSLEESFWLWGLVQLLLHQCWLGRFTNPESHAELAELALAVVARIDVHFYGPARVSDLEARVLAQAGNARRRLRQHTFADEAFLQAEQAQLQGTGNPQILAEILLLRASLERDRGRIDKARSLLEQAVAHYQRAGDGPGELRAWVTVATLDLDQAHDRDALERLEDLEERLQAPEVDPQVRNVALYNRTFAALELGDSQRLAALVERLPASDPLCHHLRTWVEAHLVREGGDRPGATVLLRRAKAGYLHLGRGWEAALLGLELIGWLLEDGDAAAAHAIAAHLFEVLDDERLPRRAVQEIIRFSKLARTPALTPETAREFRAYLRRVPTQPTLPWSFETPWELTSVS